LFVGEYDRSVDGNGRLALPATFRDELGDRCYVTTDPNGFVSITTVANFDEDAQNLMDEVRIGALPESALRNFGVNTAAVAVDKQGRITIDEEMRNFAGITPGSQAIVAGALRKLEVWRPSRYQTIRGEDGIMQPVRNWTDEES
jgi:MraZ protein